MDQPPKWYRRIVAYEWVLFCIVTILNAVPALKQPFFPSLDGPTHLYNANIIHQLLTGHSDFLSQYYAFNDWIVPNWGGHVVMTALLFIFPATLASRIFIGLCLVLLPVSFRYCVRTINPKAIFSSYLIFPFTYTFILCMGFYNFYLGLIVLFTTIGVLIRYQRSPFSMRLFLLMALLAISCYLCHLVVFITLGMIVVAICSLALIQALLNKESIQHAFKKPLLLLVAFIIPLCLTISYFIRFSGAAGEKIYVLKSELLEWIIICRSMICYAKENEATYTSLAFYVFMFLFSMALYMRIRKLQKALSEQKVTFSSIFGSFSFRDVFLLMIPVFIFLYFKLPESDSLAGFVSVRMNLMIFLFLILWVSGFEYPKQVLLISSFVLLILQLFLLTVHYKDFKYLNREIAEIMVLEKEVKENTVILPVDYSDSAWLTGHNSNYLGINKTVVILENHECANPYFPLKWNPGNPMGLPVSPGIENVLQNNPAAISGRIDYIVIHGKSLFPDSLKAEVQKRFFLKKETENFLLFEKR